MKNNKLTGCAILAGLTIVLQLLSGFLTGLFPVSFSLVLIPIAVAAWFYGISGGAIVGSAFGITILIQSVTGLDKSGAMLLSLDAPMTVLCIMLRCLLVGVIVGAIAKFKTHSNKFKYFFSALVPFINTLLFVILFEIMFMDVLVGAAGSSENVLAYILLTMVGINFIVETALNVILLPPILKALEKIRK